MTSLARIHPVVEVVANVQARDLEPIWPGVLWRGKTTLLVGDPGLGKSQVTLDVASRITRGTPWPCTSVPAARGDVLLLSAEDDVADTIRPRLEAAGAALERIHFMSSVAIIGEDPHDVRYAWPSLLEHTAALRDAIEPRHDLALVVIDPLTAFLSGVDTHKTSDVRTVLALLTQLANELRVAVLAVSHLNKSVGTSAMHRITGSLAFVAAARACYAVARDPGDPDARVMLCVKNNLAKDSSGGFRYTIGEADNGAPYVQWADERCDLSAEDVLSVEASPRARAKSERDQEVEEWLTRELERGPVEATTIHRNAKAHDVSDRELRRASQGLGVLKEVAGYQGRWHWSLPESYASSVSEKRTRLPPLSDSGQRRTAADSGVRSGSDGCSRTPLRSVDAT